MNLARTWGDLEIRMRSISINHVSTPCAMVVLTRRQTLLPGRRRSMGPGWSKVITSSPYPNGNGRVSTWQHHWITMISGVQQHGGPAQPRGRPEHRGRRRDYAVQRTLQHGVHSSRCSTPITGKAISQAQSDTGGNRGKSCEDRSVDLKESTRHPKEAGG